jgi:hypothetical protein
MTIPHQSIGAESTASMNLAPRWVLRAHALYIGLAGLLGIVFDLRGVFFGLGPQGRVFEHAPNAAIGFVEAHGLAVILAFIFWNARPVRSLHWIGLAVALLLCACNLTFWQLFVATDALIVGYVTTSLHAIFAGLQLALATRR